MKRIIYVLLLCFSSVLVFTSCTPSTLNCRSVKEWVFRKCISGDVRESLVTEFCDKYLDPYESDDNDRIDLVEFGKSYELINYYLCANSMHTFNTYSDFLRYMYKANPLNVPNEMLQQTYDIYSYDFFDKYSKHIFSKYDQFLSDRAVEDLEIVSYEHLASDHNSDLYDVVYKATPGGYAEVLITTYSDDSYEIKLIGSGDTMAEIH